MNTEFNYYDFLKKKEFKYDVKIDLSGLELQGDASLSEVDPDTGEVSEVNLNEIVDENVNYVYNTYPSLSTQYTTTNEQGNDEVEKRFHDQDVIEIDDIDFDTTDNPTTITLGNDNVVIPIRPRHTLMQDAEFPVNNAIQSAINVAFTDFGLTGFGNARVMGIHSQYPVVTGGTPIQDENVYQSNIGNIGHILHDRIWITIEGADTEAFNGEFEVSMVGTDQNNPSDWTNFNIRIPSSFTTNPTGNLGTITNVRVDAGGFVKRDAFVDREIYAALGFWSTNSYNVKSGMGISDSRASGYLGKTDFYRRLNSLRERLFPLGIEILTTEYRKKIDEDTGVDLNYSYLPRKRGFKFSKSKSASRNFIAAKQAQGELLEFPNNEVTPFNMSVKDAFTAQFANAEELNAEFLSRLLNLIDALQSNPVIYSSVDLDRFTGTNPDANPPPVLIKDEPTYNYENALLSSPDELTKNGLAVAGEITDEMDPSQYQWEFTYVKTDNAQVLYQEGTTTPILDPNDPSGGTYKYDSYHVYDTYVDEKYGVRRFFYKDGNVEGDKIITSNLDFNDDVSIETTIELVEDLQSELGNIRAAATLAASFAGPTAAALIMSALSTAERNFDLFFDTVVRIRWFQKFTNQSVFDTGEFIEEDREGFTFPFNSHMARILIPVDFGYKKERYKFFSPFGIPLLGYKRIDMGVRWVELRFTDTSTYSKYRKNDTPTGKVFDLDIDFDVLERQSDRQTIEGTLVDSLPQEILNRDPDTVNVIVTGASHSEYNGKFSATVIDDVTIQYRLAAPTDNSSAINGSLQRMIIPLTPTESDDEPRDIRVSFDMPHLPFDDELRDKVFNDFGPFDQSSSAVKSRGGDYTILNKDTIELDNDIPGWEIFQQSSKEISAMRGGIDVYNKVQFLKRILENEFSKSRVKLIETTRSFRDQETLQLGGAASSFLSWHNFGLAVKIVITHEDGITQIKDGSNDFKRLLNVAEAFCTGARNGDYGTPMNVVWCGQLVTGPDIFVWEFLPIGVEHKDALKFRDSAYQQKDAIIEHSYVNVDANGYLLGKNDPVPDSQPYIREGSKGISESIVINGEHWVHPKFIKNYAIPNNLILKDIQEFLSLIKGKMDANGTALTGRKKISEWKAKNPKSFTQLVLFYGLTGALSTTRGLLSGDYIEKFQNLVNTLAEKDPIKFVQNYLGSEVYNNIRIYVEDLSDSSYINLSDGKLTTPVQEARSTHPEGSGNTFGQKQIDFGTVEFGQYQDGVFVPEGDDDIITITTPSAVISGYSNDGKPFEGDAYLLHTLVANQIVDEFETIKENFNNLSIKFMHDKFFEGSNSGLANLLENEFGIIKTQDLMTFEELRQMYDRIDINNRKTDGDGGVRGAGANLESQNENSDIGEDADRNKNQSIFEKLVSNSQLTGIKKSSLTREKPIIEPLKNNVKVEDVIEVIQKQRIPKVRDIL